MGRHDRQEGRTKKLIEAARRWASSGGGRDEAADDLAEFGVDPEEIEKCLARKPESFEVWPANWPAVETFCALATQWRRAGAMGARVGLDYSAILPVARMLGHKPSRDLFERLQAMEYEAVNVFASQRGG